MIPAQHDGEADRPVVLTFPLILVLAFAGLGLVLTGAVVMGTVEDIDRSLVEFIQRPAVFEPVALFFNGWLHSEGLPLLWGCSLVAFLVFRKWPVAGFFALVALLAPLNHMMKLLVDRPRPSGSFRILEYPADPSFPSGHTAAAVGFFGAWFIVAGSMLPRRYAVPVRVVCVVAIVLAGVSRVWSGAHWPTDVLGSVLIGSAFVLAMWLVVNAAAPGAGLLFERARVALPAWASRPLSAAREIEQEAARAASSSRVRPGGTDPGY